MSGRLMTLFAAVALSACTAADQRADPLPSTGPGGTDAVAPPECSTEPLRPHCDAVAYDADLKLLELEPNAKRVGPPKMTVLRGPRLRYSVRLRFRGVARGEVVADYLFRFSRWETVEDSPDLLVFRKRVDGYAYEATLRLDEVGRPGRPGFGYDVDAVLETREPVL